MSAMGRELMSAAIEVAKLAGRIALEHFQAELSVETKPDGSPVTAADRAAEQAARAWIEHHFPGDGILGEEFGTLRPDAPRRWVVDPIDGTKSFIHGVPLWGTLVAVAEGEEILAGVAHFPAVGELLAAAPGEGCFRNEARCAVSQVSDLSRATVLSTEDRFLEAPEYGPRFHALAAKASLSRTWGDCYGYLLVATGRAEVMVDEVYSPWDGAALLPIIEEAGGVFTDWTGRRTAFGGGGIATNRALADEVRRGLCAPSKGQGG